jgi:acetyltransferase-like isoleucine patch superfamily enzyme
VLKDYMAEASPALARLYLATRAESASRYFIEQSAQAMCGWLPTGLGLILRSLVYTPLLAKGSARGYFENGVELLYMSGIHCGRSVYVDRHARIHASPARIELGDHCRVMWGAYLCTYVSNSRQGEGIVTGRNCWIGVNCVIASGQGGIFLGDNVLIGPNTILVTGDHDYRQKDRETIEQAYVGRPILIGNNVWIGANAAVLGGVSVGSRAVIAAGAVVTNDVSEGTVVGGIPAQVLKL